MLDAISFEANLRPRYIQALLTSLEEELPDSEAIQEAFEQLKSRAREILEPLS